MIQYRRVVNEVETIGQRMQRLRIELGMSQEALGEALGVGRSTVIRYESGQTLPNSDVILRLCAVFGVSADYLLGLKDEGLPVRAETVSAGQKGIQPRARCQLTQEMKDYIDRAVKDALVQEMERRGRTPGGV